MSVRDVSSRRLWTYQADILSKIGGGGKSIQNSQDLFEWLQDFVFFLEFFEVLRLITEDVGNGLDGVIILEALGEWMFGQLYACMFLVVV